MQRTVFFFVFFQNATLPVKEERCDLFRVGREKKEDKNEGGELDLTLKEKQTH